MAEVTLMQAYLPHIVCVGGAVLAVALDAFGRRGLAILAAALGVLAGGVLALIAAGRSASIVGEVVLTGSGYSGVVFLICLLGGALILGSWRSLHSQPHAGGLAALLAIVVAAAAVVPVTIDLLILLIALETMALCAYTLVWSGRSARATEAAVKYFVQGAVATGIFVTGLAIIIGLYGGSPSYVRIMEAIGSETGPPVTTALVLLVFALTFKLGAFPFHSWTLDAFENAPPYAAALLAGIPKFAVIVAAMILFTRTIFAGVGIEYHVWVFGALAVGSMLFGALGGLAQHSYTRMLAYSGIAQVGYALVAFVGGQAGMLPAAVLIAAYAVAGSVVFLAPAAFRAVRPTWDGSVAGLAGLGRERRLLSAAVTIAIFSLVGMPLTAGFIGKFVVFGTVVNAGYWYLAVVGVLASVVSFGYYGMILKAFYFDRAASPGIAAQSSDSPDQVVATPDHAAETVVVLGGLALLAVGTLPLIFGLSHLFEFLRFG